MTNTNNKITWGSHIPLHLALLKTYAIDGTIEYGAGVHSTQMFFNNTKHSISIETDLEWVNYVKKNIQYSDDHNIEHLDLRKHFPEGRQQRSMRSWEFKEEYFADAAIQIFKLGGYDNIKQSHMFVDCISSLRHFVLTNFYKYHDFITFHDYNKTGQKNHWKNRVIAPKGYKMYVDTTYPAHTGLWIRNEKVYIFSLLKEAHAEEVYKYTGKSHSPNIVKIVDNAIR